MAKDLRTIFADFNIQATGLFSHLFNDFRNEADTTETHSNDNNLLLIRARYVQTLKIELTKIAASYIEESADAQQQGRVRNGLTERIQYFSREFSRKSLHL